MINTETKVAGGHQCGVCQGRGWVGYTARRDCENCDATGWWTPAPTTMTWRLEARATRTQFAPAKIAVAR